MSATTATSPVTAGKSWTHATRVTLIALAVVVLLALSFVLGRASGSTTQSVPAIAPAAGIDQHVGDRAEGRVQTSTVPCRIGRPC